MACLDGGREERDESGGGVKRSRVEGERVG